VIATPSWPRSARQTEFAVPGGAPGIRCPGVWEFSGGMSTKTRPNPGTTDRSTRKKGKLDETARLERVGQLEQHIAIVWGSHPAVPGQIIGSPLPVVRSKFTGQASDLADGPDSARPGHLA
jgi:hypothetical protein